MCRKQGKENCLKQMGPWRALMGRARGRPRYPSPFSASSSSASLSFSSLSLAKAEQHQPCPPAPIARFGTPSHESHDACARLNEPVWRGLGLGFSPLTLAQRNVQNVEALLEEANDFLLDSSSNEGLGRPDLRSLEGSLHTSEQKKAWLIARALPRGTLSFTKPWLNAGASLDDTKASLMGFLKHNTPKHAEGFSLRFSMCDSAIRVPGFYGSEDFVIQADSVKRKRKKKMNKHKHRKLRRLARKSHK